MSSLKKTESDQFLPADNQSVFLKFQSDILTLKNHIADHNHREAQQSNQHPPTWVPNRHRFLKKISEPKYNQILINSFDVHRKVKGRLINNPSPLK